MLTEVAHLRISPALRELKTKSSFCSCQFKKCGFIDFSTPNLFNVNSFLKLYSYVDLLGAVVVFAFVIFIYLTKQYYPKKLCHKKNITKKISSRKIENTFHF